MKRRNFIYKTAVFAGTIAGSQWAVDQNRAHSTLRDLEENFATGLQWCQAHQAQLLIEKGKYHLSKEWIDLFNGPLKSQTTLWQSLKINGNHIEFNYDVAIDFGDEYVRSRNS